MSNSDTFIEEVSEEVRRDKLFQAIRRYGWIAVVLVVLIVAGAAYNEWQKARDAAEAQAFGDAIVAALEHEDTAERREALLEIPTEGTQTALVAMLAADASGEDNAPSAEVLKQVSEDMSLPALYRELATLKYAMMQQGSMELEAARDLLEPLTMPGAPYRLLAAEQIALAEIAAGERDAAMNRLREILEDGQVTQDLRRRVSRLIVALGGSLDAS